MAAVLVVMVLALAGAGGVPWPPPPPPPRCERIQLSGCQQLGYQWTVMPNLMGNRDQKEAEEAMSAYGPLLASQCSDNARFFLCSAFAPLCSEEVAGAVGGCRGLCERVAAACAREISALPTPARALLDCGRFPDRADRARLCMRPPPANASEPASAPPPRWPFDDDAALAPCPPGLARASSGACALPCAARPDDGARADAWSTWVAAAAWLSLLSTAFAVLTFCADPSRFRYPERPVVFLAACHAAVALAQLARGWLEARAPPCAAADADGLASAPCAAFFSVTHYFTLAADAWFLNACVAWYLTAASEWSTEALERASAYFHAAAWGWAGAWTAAALALRRVAADEATGACGVAAGAAGALVGVPRGALLAAAAALGAGAWPGVRRVRAALDARGSRRVGRLAARAAAAGALYWLAAAAGAAARVWAARRCAGCATLLCLVAGCAAGAWACSRKSVRVWRRAVCPPRKATPPPQPLLPPAPAHLVYSKRPHVSRV